MSADTGRVADGHNGQDRGSRRARAIVAAFVLWIGMGAAPASAGEPATRVPQENVDAFVQDCRADDLPSATCQCMARRMIEKGPDGEMALDIMGLRARIGSDEAAENKAFIAALDRYNATPTQAQAALTGIAAASGEMARSCV